MSVHTTPVGLSDAPSFPVESIERRKGKVRWRPKKWRPEYDRIVAYSALGKSNKWIASQLSFTPEHVSIILNLPEGKAMMDRLQTKLRDRIEVNIPEVLDEVAQKAASRIKEVLFDDDLFKKSPFAVIGVGMDILKGKSHLQGGGNGSLQPMAPGSINIGTLNVTQAQKSDILDGLQKIAEVKALHAGTGSGNGTGK